MSALDGLPKTQFGTIVFPAEGITLKSSGRKYLFEFPHQPAGAFEKLGRGIWVIQVKAVFAQNLRGYSPTLYPNDLFSMRQLYETQLTETFVHPTQGSFPAFISEWSQDYDPKKMRNGERVSLEFVEDQQTDFLSSLTNIAPGDLETPQSVFDDEIADVYAQLNASQSAQNLFAAMRGLSNAISALSGTTAMYTGLLQAKAIELSNVCGQVDALPEMQGSITMGALDALHNLWAAATAFTQPTTQPISTYTTPQTMTVTAVAIAIYNDSSRASDILNLNGAIIQNPYAIPANTDLKYFPATSS